MGMLDQAAKRLHLKTLILFEFLLILFMVFNIKVGVMISVCVSVLLEHFQCILLISVIIRHCNHDIKFSYRFRIIQVQSSSKTQSANEKRCPLYRSLYVWSFGVHSTLWPFWETNTPANVQREDQLGWGTSRNFKTSMGVLDQRPAHFDSNAN